MKPYSVTRRLVTTVLLLELLSAMALTWLAVAYEGHSRFRAFDLSLRARAESLFGAVGDADDPDDNVVLDLRGVRVPSGDLFDVELENGRVLGRSPDWPAQAIDARLTTASRDGVYPLTVDSRAYRFVVLHAVRIVDPGESGGIPRPVVIRYGAWTKGVWSEVWEAVRFYAVASLLLLMATGFAMAWFLRRSLAPLAELANDASKISAQQWQFHPHESALRVAELAPLASALDDALKRLKRSFEQQRRFTSDAAHELKTDLAIAKSSLQLLAMRRRLAEEYEQGLEVCLADMMRLERTVSDMLMLARVESTERQGVADQHSAADLSWYLSDAVKQLQSYAALRAVVIQVDSAPSANVRVGEKESRILCANLLLNALQHSRPSTEIIASVADDRRNVTLTITDQGEGISPQALPHVFEPFYRDSPSRDRREGGTGLGLAICKGICERAGGRISIESRPGEGTQVIVHLPSIL
jgi:signal transduction histidine kinase